MSEPKHTKQPPSRPPTPAAMNTHIERLKEALERVLDASPAERNELLASCGVQLSYLERMLDAFIQSPEELEHAIKALRRQLRRVKAPGAGTLPMGARALEIAQALRLYLKASPPRQALLLNEAGRGIWRMHQVIWALTDPDQRSRGSKTPPPEYIRSMQKLYTLGKWKRSVRG